jgi:Na+/H+-dicarboxylate symporter
MDGGAIYQVSCVIFFSQIYGLSFDFHEYVIIVLMSTIASIGGAGIPSGVLLFLGMVLHSVGMPMDGVLIVATIDRILDMFTTAINVTGDIFATLMVEISEKRLNKKIYNSK